MGVGFCWVYPSARAMFICLFSVLSGCSSEWTGDRSCAQRQGWEAGYGRDMGTMVGIWSAVVGIWELCSGCRGYAWV